MDKAIGGSDRCHTCAAHCLVIMEDLEPRIAKLEGLLRRAMTQIGTSSKLYLECQSVLPQSDRSAE